MGAAGGIVDDAAVAQTAGRLQRGAAGGGGTAEHLAVDRIAVDPEIEPAAHLGPGILGRLQPLHRRDIVRGMEAQQRRHARRLRLEVVRFIS